MSGPGGLFVGYVGGLKLFKEVTVTCLQWPKGKYHIANSNSNIFESSDWETIWKRDIRMAVLLGENCDPNKPIREANLLLMQELESSQYNITKKQFKISDGYKYHQVTMFHFKGNCTGGIPDDIYSLLYLMRLIVENKRELTEFYYE